MSQDVLTIQVQDSVGNSVTSNFIVPVLPLPYIYTTALPLGTSGLPYTAFQMLAVGGTGPYTWLIVGGTLDAGMTFSSAGILAGTPSNILTTTLQIQCMDANGLVDIEPFVLEVDAGTGSGATLQFSFPSGFTPANLTSGGGPLSPGGTHGGISAPAILLPTNSTTHQAAGIWYNVKQNIQSFQTDFTFTQQDGVYGFWFVCQNSTEANTPGGNNGDVAVADANGEGFGDEVGQTAALQESVGINFGLTSWNNFGMPATFSTMGVFVNGGPQGCNFIPCGDLQSTGINLHAGHVMACHLVYDGTVLTATLTDTTTGAAARLSFPINIPAFVGANTSWVGFTGGCVIPAASQSLLSWSYYTGYNTRLATPTFSVTPGSYAAAQSVAITAPSGSTVYYTTNGEVPTSANGTVYSAPLSVTVGSIIQAVAVQGSFTDSLVAVANYQIGSTSTPRINFPSTFASAANFVNLCGNVSLSGAQIEMAASNVNHAAGAAWYAAPLDITAFTCVFTMSIPTSASNVLGLCFVIQNQATASARAVPNSGGPYALSENGSYTGLGYAGLLNSACVVFDEFNGTGSETGYYTGGVTPTSSQINMSGSVNLRSGHLIKVTLAYSGTTLVQTVQDLTTLGTFSHTYTGVNIAAAVGASTAYVGFTFGNLTGTLNQFITNWTMT